MPLFEERVFALALGKLRITGDEDGNIRLTSVRKGVQIIFEASPDQATEIAEALKTISICVKQTRSK